MEGHLSSRGEEEGGLYWAHILRQHPLFTDQIPPALMPLWRQQTNRTAGRWGKTREAQKHTPSTCAVKGTGYPRSPGGVSSYLELLLWPDLQLRLLKVSTTTVAGGQVWAAPVAFPEPSSSHLPDQESCMYSLPGPSNSTSRPLLT